MTQILSCLLLVVALVNHASALSKGAPVGESTCVRMTPQHGKDPQTTPSPYKVAVDKTKVSPGGAVTLKISSKNQPFKGFLVQGRKIGSTSPAGTFKALGGGAQGIACGGIQDSSMTHISNMDKNYINVQWIAPNEPGTYQILTTVVKDGPTFWVAIPSEDITVN